MGWGEGGMEEVGVAVSRSRHSFQGGAIQAPLKKQFAKH